jgi:hypothetical protein
MTFLPLIERELRLRARSPAAYWTRFVVGLAGVLICLPQLTSYAAFGTPASIGQGVFHGLICAAFVLICGACLLTADALHAEQREGTLGLLLLTRVRVLDVLLGKFGSIGLTSVCVLVAFLPMLMLPVLSGGVSGGEVFRKEFGLLNILMFALASGLYASASQPERFKAARLALIVVGAVALGPYLLDVMLRGPGARPFAPSLLSPLVLLISAGDVAYRASYSSYWIAMASLCALSCLLLVGACIRLRRGVRGEGGVSAAPRKAASGLEASGVQPRRRQSFGGEASPIAWRVSQQRGLRATIWAAAALGFFHYCLYFVFRYTTPGAAAGLSSSFGLATSVVVGSLCAWAASRFFVESRHTGELELLLTTPVGAQTIVSDQWKVLKRLVRWPLVLMVAPLVLQELLYFIYLRNSPIGWWHLQFVYLPVSALLTVLGLVALCWLALWFGLRAGGQARAILWTVAITKALPYGLSMLCSVVGSLLLAPRPAQLSGLHMVIWLAPQGVDAVFFLWLIWLARRRLLGDVAAAAPMPLDLRQVISSASRETAAALRRARHWTP